MAPVQDAEQALAAADAAFEHGDVDGVVAHLSAAIREFTAADEPCRAAMACIRLGETFANLMGNLTAARAWFIRAERLVEDQPPCVEQGWVAVASMGCDVDDPDRLLASAELALDRARRFGDVNLETKALADAGLAHVQAGRLDVGMAMLDQAMALACGPADDVDAAAKSVCSFFTACYFAADFDRVGPWSQLLRRQGLLGRAAGASAFLSSHCDSVQATALVELGRWTEAEELLEHARTAFEEAMRSPSWHADIALAELRVRQGRLAEAEALLLGKDQAIQALLPAARLHLARGDHDLARATARRGLRAVGEDRLRAVELLTILVDAELAAGAVAEAAAVAGELAERTDGMDVPTLRARAAAAHARVLAARGAPHEAVAELERAIDHTDPGRLPWLHATLLLELARHRDAAGDDAGAAVDARAAASALAALDVVVLSDDHARLERLARRRDDTGPAVAPRVATLRPDGRWWVVEGDGLRFRLQDSKGLRYLAALLERPHVEHHALDLVDRTEGSAAAVGLDRRAIGDAGPLLDGDARHAYRRRVEEVRSAIDDALAGGRLEAAEALQEELDRLVRELSAAFGLGGRSRVAASAAERARLNVTRALRSAIRRIEEGAPEPGGVLDRSVRTGIYCTYRPSEHETHRWIVHSAMNGTGAN